MADHHPERGPCRPLNIQKGKQPQKAQMARKSPPPEEVFIRRPTRPMPIPTTKRKCVQDPCRSTGSPGRKPEGPSPAPRTKKAEGSVCSPSGLKRDTQPAGTRLVQDATLSVQKTHNKPHSASRTHGLAHTLMRQAQARFSDGNSPSRRHPAAQSACHNSSHSTKASGKRVAQTSTQLGQKARKKRRLSPCLSPQKCTQSAGLQPPHMGLLPNTLQPCHGPQLPPSPQIPRQPIRMLFKRLGGGQWSCKLVTAASHLPAETPTSTAQRSSHVGEVRGTASRGPWSVFQEDLQLSSSSEESEGQ